MVIFWLWADGLAFLLARMYFFIASGFALAVDKYIIKRCVLGAGTVSPGPCQIIQINDRHGYSPTGIGDVLLFLGE